MKARNCIAQPMILTALVIDKDNARNTFQNLFV